jgi:hypothetical protein
MGAVWRTAIDRSKTQLPLSKPTLTVRLDNPQESVTREFREMLG